MARGDWNTQDADGNWVIPAGPLAEATADELKRTKGIGDTRVQEIRSALEKLRE